MKQARIVMISGPPGAGKSSVARRLAEDSAYERAVHMHTDDFYGYIRKGYIEPWLPGSGDQNAVVIESFVASAARFALGGYEVLVDGVVGPWYLDPWIKLAREGLEVRYVVLRPGERETIARAVNRGEPEALTEPEAVKSMWKIFSDLGPYEANAVNTEGQSIEKSVSLIRSLLDKGAMQLT